MYLNTKDYTVRNALLWGNCKKHFEKAVESTVWNQRVVHVLIGILEAIPLISQIASLFELLIVYSIGRLAPVPDNFSALMNKVFRAQAQKLEDDMPLIFQHSNRIDAENNGVCQIKPTPKKTLLPNEVPDAQMHQIVLYLLCTNRLKFAYHSERGGGYGSWQVGKDKNLTSEEKQKVLINMGKDSMFDYCFENINGNIVIRKLPDGTLNLD